MDSNTCSHAVPAPIKVAKGTINTSDQKITTAGFHFSHHSPTIRGQIAIHKSIPTNGMQYVSDKVFPTFSAPDSAANATEEFASIAHNTSATPHTADFSFFIIYASVFII